ncbi:SurA N-terminal domain-containing protein [Candidatus Saccharibacteria bacterium]|nr:SurA N-terminal domain-containing protein [Candidatus Saccharibacteria bacterium]
MNKFSTQNERFKKLRLSKKSRAVEPNEGKVDRVTNETVAEAREDVLKSARKFIYPLTHSKHKVLTVSTALVIVGLVGFSIFMSFALYRKKDTSNFTYHVTQVVPFPIAKTGSSFVLYENYLFELKRYIYYYTNVENVDFSDPNNKPQLDDQKVKILQKVINLSYIKQLAKEKGITVSDEEIDSRIVELKKQNRLGNNDKVFQDTLKDFYNWSVEDFRRSIRNDILTSKVMAVVDIDTRSDANKALDELKNGGDFTALAAKYSDDTSTKNSGGEVPGYLDPKDRNSISEEVATLAVLKPGETSDIINIGYGLEIIKILEDKDGKYRYARILFSFEPIDDALNEIKSQEKTTVYIKL